MAVNPDKCARKAHELQGLLGQLKHMAARFKKMKVQVAETELILDANAAQAMKTRFIELRSQIADAAGALRDELLEVQ